MHALKLFFFSAAVVLGMVRSGFSQQPAYTPPALSNKNSWSLILLPDPQSYVKFGRNQPLFDLTTAWAKDRQKALRIGLVICTGDMVEQNALEKPDGINGDQPSTKQWEAAARAFDCLDGHIPYMLSTGNHDVGIVNAENRDTRIDDYFPPNKNPLNAALLKEFWKDETGKPTFYNAAYDWTSPHNQKMLILVLEFAPRNAVLDWAKAVVSRPAYRSHTVILLTHSYLNSRNERIKSEGYKLQDANYGEAIWQKLVYPASNIRLVLSGHIGNPDNPRSHVGFRSDKNAAGKPVHQMVFNAQALGGGWHGNGGDGWLRILEFMPDRKTVKVRTFSPFFAISPTTRHLAWRTADYDEFSFTF